MKVVALLLLVTVSSTDACGTTLPTETIQRRQDVVNRCVDLGGIPILSVSGQMLEKCEFPPVAPIIRLPEVEQ